MLRLLKHKTLKRKPLNWISLRRLKELNAQVPVGEELCRRAGGNPIQLNHKVNISGKPYVLTTVVCLGGVCEKCHQPADGQLLHPHEWEHRSLGGEVSLDNSIMVHNSCHTVIQHQKKGVK